MWSLALLTLASAIKFPFQEGAPLLSNLGDCSGCTLQASPQVLEQSGDWVTVNIEGVSYGQKTDWVGVFSPEDFSPDGAILSYPVRWQYATTTCYPRPIKPSDNATCIGEACCEPNDYHYTGNAVISFSLVNLHSDYVFALVQGNFQFPVTVAVSDPVTFADPQEPTGVHLALTETPGEMRVSWNAGASVLRPTVHWGTTASSLKSSAVAVTSSYAASDLCSGSIAATMGFRAPGQLASAVITGLTAGKKYYYSVGGAKAHVFSFVAPPLSGPSDKEVVIAAFGDMGKAPSAWDGSMEHSWDNPPGFAELGSWNTTRLLATEPAQGTSMVLHIGDVSYAVGYASQWDEFLFQIEETASQLPWMTSPGNHECNCHCNTNAPSELSWFGGSDSGGECCVPYLKRFPMPTAGNDVYGATAATSGNTWYSMEHGPATIIMMSTEHDFLPGSPQYIDIKRMLGAVNRTHTPWLIFTGHRPMYVNGEYPEPSTDPLQKYLEPLLLEHQVDLALWGHHHSYHRSCPLINGHCNHEGVPHAVIGAAGYDFSTLASTPPKWVIFADNSHYGYARMSLTTGKLIWQFADAATGNIIDQFELAK